MSTHTTDAPDTESEYSQLIRYHATARRKSSTDHLVERIDGETVHTACGQTLSLTKSYGPDSELHALTDAPHGSRCGNCPWFDVDVEVRD